MNPRLTSYEVTPRLLTVGETAEVRIRPLFAHAALPAAARVEVIVCERGELFGWYYSLVFAPSTDWADLRQAIRDRRSLAVEAVSGEFPRLVGPFRLVKLGYFMLREILPLHDELCVEEGRLLRGHAGGDAAAGRALGALRGRVAALYDSLWGRSDNGSRAPSLPA